MAPTRNKVSFLELFEGMRTGLLDWVVKRPREIYASLHYKLYHLPQTNFDLGCIFASQGKLQDAVFRFRIAIYLQPDYPLAQYNLGCCYLRLGKIPQARQAFIQTLRSLPNHTESLFMLSAIDPNAVAPGQRPTRMPPGMVHDFFNGLAPDYDAMEATNQYRGGAVCAEALKPLIGATTGLRLLDLGCGTGIATRPLRGMAADITGIDFSAPMVQAAQAIKIGERAAFDLVLEEDINNLATTAANIAETDIVICCNVAQFLGDLQALFSALGPKLKTNASFLITIEPLNTNNGYAVNIDTGRFGHHPDYVKKLAQNFGLTLHTESRVQLYPNIPAYLLLFTKAGA